MDCWTWSTINEWLHGSQYCASSGRTSQGHELVGEWMVFIIIIDEWVDVSAGGW